jgi:hypothetical protein
VNVTLGLASVTVAAALIGCGPSIDPAAKADVDARIANLRLNPVTVPAPAPPANESMPLAVGQWAEYKIMSQDRLPSLLTQKIVGEIDGAFLVEIVHDTYEGHTAEQLLVAVGDRMDPKKVELRAVKLKDAKGRVTTLSQTNLLVARNGLGPVDLYWEDAVSVSLANHWRGATQASTVVAAGRFEACYFIHSAQRRMRRPWIFESWSHPAVPLGGLVRQQDDRGFVSELVAYGISGAQSDF